MTIPLSDVLNARKSDQSFTPAKREPLWKNREGGDSRPAPIRMPSGSMLPSDPEIRAGLTETAERYKINPALLMALAQQESTYNPDAVGPKTKWGHATGMFQFLDSTAKGHGIDPMDWRQAADAAAKDLASQIASKGLDWAVAHHHGGGNPRLHGPKTAQYTREVLAKAQVIAQELGIPFEVPEGQMPDAPEKKPGTISLSEVLSARPQQQDSSDEVADIDPEQPQEESIFDTAKRRADAVTERTGIQNPGLAELYEGVTNTIERGWAGLQNFLNRETEEVTLTDEELRRDWERVKTSRAVTEYGMTFDQWAARNRTRTVSSKSYSEEEAEWVARLEANPNDVAMLPKRLAHLRPRADDSNFAPENTLKGFTQRIIANFKNPTELFLQDSIPANIVTTLFTLPEVERKKFEQLRSTVQALEVTTNPDQYSREEVDLANQTLEADNASRDTSVVNIFKELWQASKEDPSVLGQSVLEAIAADPYLLAAPVGVGIKPLQAARAAQGAAANTIASRAARIADSILDGSITAGGINVAAGAAANLAETGEINTAEAKLNAAMGVVFGGTLAPLFMKSAKARSKSIDAHRLEGTLDEALRDMAKADVEAEAQATRFQQSPEEYDLIEGAMRKEEWRKQQRFAELMGIRSKKDVDSWKAQRRKEIREWFKDNPEYADYQAYLAEERVARAQAEAAELNAQRERAAARDSSSETLAAERRQRWQEEFDAAIEARNAAQHADLVEAARAEDAAWEAAKKLNAEELFEAEFSGDHPTIRQTEAKIRRRNDQLGRHRRKSSELGQADPETLARLGVAGAGAAAGLALFPEDEKLAGTLLGGLAGLLTPAGGSVLSRMKQAGAISSDGHIIAGLVKAGKMANKLDEAEIRARDNALVNATRAGDQQAFKVLYETYMPTLTRYANRFVEGRESRIGAGAEDMAQMAMADFYNFITKNPDVELDRPVIAWLRTAAKNRSVDAVRSSEGATRRADVVNESQYYNEDLYEGDRGSGRSILDDSIDTNAIQERPASPEDIQVRDEVFDIIRQALDTMPEKHQQLFAMTKLDDYSIKDAADALGLTHANALQISKRVQDRVANAIRENRRRLGEEISPAELQRARSQRGSASVKSMAQVAVATAAITGAGTAGFFLSDGDIWKTAVSAAIGGPAGLALATGRMKGSRDFSRGNLKGINRVSAAIRGIDYRMKDISPSLWGRAKEHGANELREIRKFNDDTAEFNAIFLHLPKDIKPIVVKALSTRDKNVINKILREVGGDEFVKAFEPVRKRLNIIEDNLVDLGLISKSEMDYFPFKVKDLEGLKNQLGSEASNKIDAALADANKKMQAREGRNLTAIEEAVVLNKVLEPYIGKPLSVHTPGFAKARTIRVIDESLQPFYHDPIATLNSYGVQAIKYIERAKFFGRHLRKTKNDQGRMAVNISDSIGELAASMRESGELTPDKAAELASMLQDRFNGGEVGASEIVQGVKDITNGSLLGNIYSAATQLGDMALQMHQQGLIPTIKTFRRMLFRDKIIDLKHFGLDDHVAHEFLSDNWTRKYADTSLKWSGFSAIDRVGKNFGLGAAVERMMIDAKSPKGLLRLSDRFGREFPDLLKEALPALKKGEVNEAVEVLAFSELSRTQPLTAWELPQYYHRMPNGRIVYQMQTFNLRVMNLVYEDALRKLASSKAKDIATGAKALIGLSAILGLQGVATDKIKDMLAGKPVELEPAEIPINALEALGMSTYDYDRLAESGPAGLVQGRTPGIVRMSSNVWKEPERSMQYIPVVGKPAYTWSNILLADDPDAARKDKRQGYWEQRRRKRMKEQGYKMEITVPPNSSGGSRGSRGSRGGSRGSR